MAARRGGGSTEGTQVSQEDPDTLVAGARTGDQAAWRALYVRDAGRLTVWLRSLPNGDWASSAEDIAAEAWLTAASKIGEIGRAHV